VNSGSRRLRRAKINTFDFLEPDEEQQEIAQTKEFNWTIAELNKNGFKIQVDYASSGFISFGATD